MERSVPKAGLSARAPLFGAACALAIGMSAGRVLVLEALPLAVAGAALCRIAPGRWWRLLSWGLLGWVLLHAAEAPWRTVVRMLDTTRPVVLTGDVVGCWEEGPAVHGARFRLRTIRQGGRVWRTLRAVRLYTRDLSALAPCGSRLRLRGYLRPPRRFENDPAIEVGQWSLFLESPRLVETVRPPGSWGRLSTWIRSRALRSDPRSKGERLARALLTGERARLPPEWAPGLQRWGLSHLLAVSGLHVGILAAGVALISAPLPRPLRFLAVGIAVGAYLALAGPRPSLVRAGTMFLLGASAFLLRRPPSPLNALALAVLGMLVLDPSNIAETGFQLSVVATFGILLLATTATSGASGIGSWLGSTLAVTLSAQIATLPWALAAFHRIPLLAPAANLVAAPWIAVTLAASILDVALALCLPGAPRALAGPLDLLALPLDLSSAAPASVTRSLVVESSWIAAIALTAGAIVGMTLLAGRERGRRERSLGAGLIAGSLLLGTVPSRAEPATLELVALDVGQGDALILRDGARSLILDAGGWDGPGFGGRVVAPVLARLGARRPRALAVSHGDRDHCGGIADLARELVVDSLWIAAPARDAPCVRELLALPWLDPAILREGEVRRLGRWRLWVLGPPAAYRGDPNGGSLVIRAEAFGRCVLLTGDIDAAAERRLVARWPDEVLRCDLLKVAHHGSRSSTTLDLLRAVRPRRAIVSAGRNNPYGHPAEEVVGRLERRRIQLLRTDLHGMIRIRWPGPGASRTTTALGARR